MRIPEPWRDALLRGPAGRFIRDAALRYPSFFGPRERVTLGREVQLMNTVFNTSCGEIRVGDHSFFGHSVLLLTGTHDMTRYGSERAHAVPHEAGRDIIIGQGVWIASGVTVLGPCTIGDHAVLAAGSLVTHDVPERAVVAGAPARVVRTLAPVSGTCPPEPA